jgi:hypothetical protein
MEQITAHTAHNLTGINLAQLIAQVRTTTPINGKFEVTLNGFNEYYPELPPIIYRIGTSTNIKALNRISRADISPRSVADGYTLKGAYMALLSDTEVNYIKSRPATEEELKGLFFICDTLNLAPNPNFKTV